MGGAILPYVTSTLLGIALDPAFHASECHKRRGRDDRAPLKHQDENGRSAPRLVLDFQASECRKAVGRDHRALQTDDQATAAAPPAVKFIAAGMVDEQHIATTDFVTTANRV
jgi:hypothetical protein